MEFNEAFWRSAIMPARLDEVSLRRPGFVEGTRVVLGDGQSWSFPLPRLYLFPARAADGSWDVGSGRTHGPAFDELVDRLLACDPDDLYGRLAIQFQMAASLLVQNYILSDDAMRILLAVDTEDPDCADRWARINDALLGRPPKPSADGSAGL
jgi:hypothetical protein